LKKFAQELSLSDTQKEQLRTHLVDKHPRLQELLKRNANISRTELVQKIVSIRGSLREQVVKFLTPQQLAKWDAEEARAKKLGSAQESGGLADGRGYPLHSAV